MAGLHKRLRGLINTIERTDDWADLSVEDAVAIILALSVVETAQDKFPGMFTSELRRTP